MWNETGKVGKIAICNHAYEDVDHDVYMNHMYCIAKWARQYDLCFVGKHGLDAATARNSMVDAAKENGCEWLFWWDEDHFTPTDALPNLLEAVSKQDVNIVSGLVCKKGERMQQVCWYVRGPADIAEMTLPLDGQLHEVSICAFCATLISMKALERLQKPYFRDTCEQVTGYNVPINIRSDVNLCNMFRAVGEKIWVDTRVLIGHKGFKIPVYPQNAVTLSNLLQVATESVKLKEGQIGSYYFPGELV
jgi:hypothetical protein